MLDVTRTLAPELGLVRGVSMVRPSEEMPLWSVGCEIDETGHEDDSYQMGLVGACGFGRAETMIRAAGEAVERRGMLLSSDDSIRVSGAPAGVLRIDGRTGRFGRGDLAARGGFYLGRTLDSGRAVAVPERLVTYPWPAGHDVDDSPSGAAAGSSLERATDAALLEIVERDAVMTAWFSDQVPTRVEFDDPHLGRESESARELVLRSLGEARLRIARVDSPIPGVTVALATLVGRRDGRMVGAVGSKASILADEAFAGAIRESLQVFALMTEHASRMAEVLDPFPMTTLSRTLYWTSAHAVRHMESWVEAWADGGSWPEPTAGPFESLLGRFVAADLDPVRIDLTPRLPEGIRALGWNCVKILCPGLQRLIMDESRPGVFDPERLPGLVWGDGVGVPHPWV